LVVNRLHKKSIRLSTVIAVSLLVILLSTLLLVGCQTPPLPLSVELTARPYSGPPPLQVSFSVTPHGGKQPYKSIVFHTGDETTIPISAGETYTHTYYRPDKYTAAVTVVDSNGGVVDDSIIIDVLAASFVPGEVIVGYADEGAARKLIDLIPALGGEVIEKNSVAGYILVRVEDGNEKSFINLVLQKAPGVAAYAELNYTALAQAN